jgi:hypothetical protein
VFLDHVRKLKASFAGDRARLEQVQKNQKNLLRATARLDLSMLELGGYVALNA